MTAFVLVSGSLFRAVEQRTSSSGKRYSVATLKASASEGEGSDFWSIVAFSDTVQAELSRLALGEQLSVQGKLKVELYARDGGNQRISRTIFAENVLALRALPRERRPKDPIVAPRSDVTPSSRQSSTNFDDDIPF